MQPAHHLAQLAFDAVALNSFAHFFGDDEPIAIMGVVIGCHIHHQPSMRPALSGVSQSLKIIRMR